MELFDLSDGQRRYLCPCEQVRNITETPPCSCPTRFLVEKQPKGCYRIGDKVLYVRVSDLKLSVANPERIP